MENKLHIFEPRFDNEELEKEFNNFFYKYNLTPLFTNEHRSTPISVTYLDAKSVFNPTGSYHKILKDFSDYLLYSTNNKSYEDAIFKLLYQSRSFQALINNIKKLKNFIETGIDVNHMYNMWNIVFYNKEII